jgi:hypothetical protein
METILAYILEKMPLIGGLSVVAIAAGAVVWAFSKLYHRFTYVEAAVTALSVETKRDIADIRADLKTNVVNLETKLADIRADLKANVLNLETKLVGVRTELKADVVNLETKLKENDFYHTNKALLLIGAEVLKNNPERFERVKDTILSSTPDNLKDEIKSITL